MSVDFDSFLRNHGLQIIPRKIFSFLDYSSLKTSLLVCKLWNTYLMKERTFWIKFLEDMTENYNPEEHRRAFSFNLHAFQAFLQPLIKNVTVKGSIKEILFCLELFEYDRLKFGREINSELDKEFLLVSYEILSK